MDVQEPRPQFCLHRTGVAESRLALAAAGPPLMLRETQAIPDRRPVLRWPRRTAGPVNGERISPEAVTIVCGYPPLPGCLPRRLFSKCRRCLTLGPQAKTNTIFITVSPNAIRRRSWTISVSFRSTRGWPVRRSRGSGHDDQGPIASMRRSPARIECTYVRRWVYLMDRTGASSKPSNLDRKPADAFQAGAEYL